MPKMIKRTVLCVAVPILLFGQDDFYPSGSFYGGGVGFSQMFLFLDVWRLEGFEYLGSVGDTAGLGLEMDPDTSPFVIKGGEGFSHITGRWRIGGYAGVGSSFMSGKPNITLYLDTGGNGVYDAGSDTLFAYTGDYAPDIQAKFSMWIGGATVEFVFPIFRGLEVATGSLMGIGRASLSISESSGSPGWNDQFSSVFEIGPDGYYAVTDVNGDGKINSDDISEVQARAFFTRQTAGVMRSMSGTFFAFQPYAAVKLQFLDRVGLRLSVGFNLGKVEQGRWVLNDRNAISDSPATSFNALAMRAMIYFGL